MGYAKRSEVYLAKDVTDPRYIKIGQTQNHKQRQHTLDNRYHIIKVFTVQLDHLERTRNIIERTVQFRFLASRKCKAIENKHDYFIVNSKEDFDYIVENFVDYCEEEETRLLHLYLDDFLENFSKTS